MIAKFPFNSYKEVTKTEDYESAYEDGFDDGFDMAQIMLADKPWVFELCDAIYWVVKEKQATREEVAYMVDLNFKRLMQKKKEGVDLDVSLFDDEEEDNYGYGN